MTIPSHSLFGWELGKLILSGLNYSTEALFLSIRRPFRSAVLVIFSNFFRRQLYDFWTLNKLEILVWKTSWSEIPPSLRWYCATELDTNRKVLANKYKVLRCWSVTRKKILSFLKYISYLLQNILLRHYSEVIIDLPLIDFSATSVIYMGIKTQYDPITNPSRNLAAYRVFTLVANVAKTEAPIWSTAIWSIVVFLPCKSDIIPTGTDPMAAPSGINAAIQLPSSVSMTKGGVV